MEALSITQLIKVYPDNFTALKGISFTVKEGDFYALLGPNGAGKSTTIGIITSLINKTSGQVKVFGYDIDSHFENAKACLGLVPQEFNFGIFESVLDIVVRQAGYYGIKYKEAVPAAEFYLKKLGLWEKHLEPAKNLSGGMKRRLMIARSLVHRPKLLILDEPTAGVDIETRRSMWEFLVELNRQGTTIILTTHYLEEAENLCKHITIIDKGVVVETTGMQHLLRQLNTETFIFYLQKPLLVAPHLPEFTIHLQDESTLEIEIKKGQNLNYLFHLLSLADIEVSSMRNKANRLEELFLRLIKK